jgi:putative aldouronate transport system permease protein
MVENFKLEKRRQLVINIIMIAFSILCIYPIVLMIAISFSESSSIYTFGYSIFPKEFSLLAYEYIFADPTRLISGYEVTIIVSLGGGLFSLIVSSMIAYPLSRKDFTYKKKLNFFVFFTMLFNGGLVPTYMVVTNVLHLKDNLWVLILPYAATAWNILLLRSFFASIPSDIIEAARIDGAGEFRTFAQIIIPLSKPGLSSVGFLIVLRYWNDWWLSMLYIQTGTKESLQYKLYTMMQGIEELARDAQVAGAFPDIANFPSESARMAMAVLSIAPILFLFPLFQKYLVKGITVGAVKG